MANITRRLEQNISGNFYVDNTCIDCSTCTYIAPDFFRTNQNINKSIVYNQPNSNANIHQVLQALYSCPTNSIGFQNKNDLNLKNARHSFPLAVKDEVFYTGFNSENSFGASSWFIKKKSGNVLIDSPKYNPVLIKNIEAMGGIDYIMLTHEDDVADYKKFAAKFNAKTLIHKDCAVTADIIITEDSRIWLDSPIE